LDIAVLQYQNQKLTQKLETQKLEYTALENKFSQLKERQQSYDSTLAVVKKSWEQSHVLNAQGSLAAKQIPVLHQAQMVRIIC
ncbi:E3 ubiquitin-protein ligase BRE1-like protein, partial [Trifolium medium]|nr:E3 ubiquitin-protein ligase BRE1-like protein [Trifolium medium]